MYTTNQYYETNKNNCLLSNNINFSSKVSVLKTLKSSKDSVTLSESARLNSGALKWIQSKFGNTEELYNACLNSDNNVSGTALNFLKSEVSKRKPLQRLFKGKEKDTYQNFGDKFLSIMLESAKNNEKNHTDSNIEFLDTVLTHYESDKPKDYLDVVINSKGAEGNINAKTSDIFKAFYSQNGDTEKYCKFIKGLLALPKNEQDFIFNNFVKHSNSELFKLLQLAQGSNSEKLISAVSEDLDKGIEPYHITGCLISSKDANNEPNLYNYQKLKDQAAAFELRFDFEHEIRDKKGIIQDSNISATTELAELFKDIKYFDTTTSKVIKEHVSYLKDDDGIICKEFADKYTDILNQYKRSSKSDFLKMSQFLLFLKDLNVKISKNMMDSLEDFYSFYINLEKEKTDTYFTNIFKKTIDIIRDNNGDITTAFNPYISDLSKSGLATSVPYILQIARGKGGKEGELINTEVINAAKEFIPKYSSQYRKDSSTVAELLTKLVDKNECFDIKTLNPLNTLVSTNTDCDIFEVCSAIRNPEGKISDIGLNFAESLLKDFQKQKDDFYINTISLAKDKKGEFNENNISFIKRIIHITDKVKQYTETAKDSEGIVDKDFGDNLIEVLSKNKHPEDYENIIKCIKLLTNKKGEIQWQYVNNITSLKRHTDKSLECTKHDTFRKILNILTDKDGNVLPSFNDFTSKINEMIKDGLLTEIPIILSMVQKDGVIEDELCKALKSLVLNESAEKRYETAKKLADLAKNGFDKDFFTKITNLKINGDKYKILNELKNSDDKISQTGFDFLVHLRKECHIKEEKDILSFLKLAKDKSGDFSSDNISFIKDISKIVPKYDIAKIYIGAAKQNTGTVDKNYYDNLIKVLSKKGP